MDAARGELSAADRLLVGLRIAAVLLWTCATVALLFLAWLPTLALPRRGAAAARARTRRRLARLWGAGALRALSVRVAARGTPPPRGVLIVSNHLSYLDVLVLIARLPAVFVAKAGLRRWPLLGPVATLGGTVYIDRSQKRDVFGALAGIERALGRGDTVVVFPEATTGDGASLLPFKPALLSAAAAEGSPVHWLTLSYSTAPGGPSARDRICWWQPVGFAAHAVRLLALRRIECRLRFGPAPIAAPDRKALAAALRRAMLERFEPVAR